MTSRRPIEFKDRVIYEEKVTLRGQHYYEAYTLGKMLGKGGFATCYEIRDSREGKKNAVKIISKTYKNSKGYKEDCTEKIKEEIAFIGSLDHPGIVNYIHHFHDRQHYFIILGLCHYGSFSDILKRRKTLTEPETRYFVAQIVEILMYIKSKNIIHRDIKLANFFVDEDYKIRLGDFGLATYYHNTYRTRGRLCGTPNYIAPEIIEKRAYGFEVDVWSTGILIFSLLYGVPPFETKSVRQTYFKIRTCTFKFEGFKNSQIMVSKDAQDFIRRILTVNPRERLKIEDFMAHPFMSRYKIPKQLESTFLTSLPSASFMRLHGRISKKKEAALIKKEKQAAQKLAETTAKIFKIETRPLIVTYKDALGVKIQERHEERWFQTPPKSEKTCQEQEEVNGQKDVPDAEQEDQSICGRKKFCPNIQAQLVFTAKKEEKPKKEEVAVKVEKEQPIPQPKQWKRPDIIFKLKYVDRTAQNQQLYEKQTKVVFWQNATQQYGLVYVLSNHQIGIYFNDTSTIISSTNRKQIHYLERKQGKVIEQVIPFDDQKTSKEEAKDRFHKKLQIFTYHHWNLRKTYPFIEELSENSEVPSAPLHVKSFKPVDRVMAIFKMSDNNIQYFFEDISSVFMSFTANIISYKCNDKLAVATFPLTEKTVILPEFKTKIQSISSFYKKFLPKKSAHDSSESGHSMWNIKQERSKSALVKTKQE